MTEAIHNSIYLRTKNKRRTI